MQLESDDEHLDPTERKYRFYTDGLPEDERNVSDSSDSEPDEVRKLDKMANEIDASIK